MFPYLPRISPAELRAKGPQVQIPSARQIRRSEISSLTCGNKARAPSRLLCGTGLSLCLVTRLVTNGSDRGGRYSATARPVTRVHWQGGENRRPAEREEW